MTASRAKSEVLAIIPARGGSKGIPRKNLRLLWGKPLVAYTIEAALCSDLISRAIVSTEDDEITEVSKEYGAEVVSRPPKLAQDDSPSVLVYQHAIRHLEEVDDYRPESVVVLQPTSPLRTTADVDAAIRMLLDKGCHSVVSVCEVEHPLEWMYTLRGDRLERIVEGDEKVARRQDAPKVYRLNGAVYVTGRRIIMEENRVLGGDTRGYVMPRERSIDIDTELDLKLAELLMAERT